MPEEALQAAFEIKTACDEISRRLLRWHWEHKPGAHSLGALLDHVAQRQQESLEQKQVTVTHLLQQARANRSASSMQHMLSDFLTGHEDMSIRVSYADGTLLFEKLHQPLDDLHSARRSFSVVLPAHVDQQEQQVVQVLLMLDRRPDDALLRQLAWILALAAVSSSLLSVGKCTLTICRMVSASGNLM